jgi:hypothetical protein
MASSRIKKPSTKKRRWNQKKKGETQARNPNRGLPGDYIKTYGQPVERTLISGNVWNEFYNSAAGQQRAARLVTRYAKRIAQQDKNLALDPGLQFVLPKNTDLGAIAIQNAAAKAAASR